MLPLQHVPEYVPQESQTVVLELPVETDTDEQEEQPHDIDRVFQEPNKV